MFGLSVLPILVKLIESLKLLYVSVKRSTFRLVYIAFYYAYCVMFYSVANKAKM